MADLDVDLEHAVEKYGISSRTVDELEKRGAKLRNMDKLLEHAVEKYGIPSRTVDELEKRGAKLRNMDKLLEQAVEKYGLEMYGLPSRTVDELEKRGAKLRNKYNLLERLCLLCEPTDYTLDWIMCPATQKSATGISNLEVLFGLQAHTVEWLLRRGACIHSGAIWLLLLYKRFGDGDELRMCMQECSGEDLEYILVSQGARLTPRIVFELLSDPVVQVEGGDGTVMDAPEALFRLRSTWFEAALRWRVKKRPIKMPDVEAKDMKFIVHFIGRHPDDVSWSLLRSSLSDMAVLADEYAIIDLHKILQKELHG
jgi:hypothetical protein